MQQVYMPHYLAWAKSRTVIQKYFQFGFHMEVWSKRNLDDSTIILFALRIIQLLFSSIQYTLYITIPWLKFLYFVPTLTNENWTKPAWIRCHGTNSKTGNEDMKCSNFLSQTENAMNEIKQISDGACSSLNYFRTGYVSPRCWEWHW